MTSPPSPEGGARPQSHRAGEPAAATVRRLLPPLGAVASVVIVIVLLLFLNSRSSTPGPAPGAVEAPPSSTPSTAAPPSPSPSPSPSASATPSASPTPLPSPTAPPVSEPPATTQPAVAKAPVTVLNNSRRSGLASDAAAQLRAKGWPISAVGNYRGRIAVTTVYYAAGQLPQARELAREFPQIQRVEPRFAGLPGHGLTLVVTRDWH